MTTLPKSWLLYAGSVVRVEYYATDTRLHSEEVIYEHREEVLQQQILLHPELKYWELLEPLKLLECLPGARFCDFHFSDTYNDAQAEIWERMYQSVKKALEILVEVETNSLTREILSDKVLQVMENNYIPFLDIDDFDDTDRESFKDMVLSGESACKGCQITWFCSTYLGEELSVLLLAAEINKDNKLHEWLTTVTTMRLLKCVRDMGGGFELPFQSEQVPNEDLRIERLDLGDHK